MACDPPELSNYGSSCQFFVERIFFFVYVWIQDLKMLKRFLFFYCGFIYRRLLLSMQL